MSDLNTTDGAKTFSDGAIGILTALTTAIKEIDKDKLGEAIKNIIRNIDWLTIGELIASLLFEAWKLKMTITIQYPNNTQLVGLVG